MASRDNHWGTVAVEFQPPKVVVPQCQEAIFDAAPPVSNHLKDYLTCIFTFNSEHPLSRMGVMNQKQHYVSDESVPVHHHSITVGGKQLNVNQEVTLERGIGYPAGRYRFCYAEERDGEFMLMFFGPTRRVKQRYREVWHDGAAVRTVHR